MLISDEIKTLEINDLAHDNIQTFPNDYTSMFT